MLATTRKVSLTAPEKTSAPGSGGTVVAAGSIPLLKPGHTCLRSSRELGIVHPAAKPDPADALVFAYA